MATRHDGQRALTFEKGQDRGETPEIRFDPYQDPSWYKNCVTILEGHVKHLSVCSFNAHIYLTIHLWLKFVRHNYNMVKLTCPCQFLERNFRTFHGRNKPIFWG